MSGYDSRRHMLDSGLTILALRGLQHRDRHYPFIERFLFRRWFQRGSLTTAAAAREPGAPATTAAPVSAST